VFSSIITHVAFPTSNNSNIGMACIITVVLLFWGGPGSSVGITTDYGLNGPGSNPGTEEIFRPSTPALGPTQPPVKWVPALSRG